MITLVSIRLRNFRKVREGTFTPLESGVTGLSGANGAGKSSFLAAAIWALFGVRPDDVPTSGLRRQGSSVKDECSVSVLFRHGGQIIEVIRELRGKNNKTIMNVFVDGKEQTITTPTFAEQWIRDRLKIDASAFTTAFVVRQKELDSLVDARPAERRATIERLSGIEKMSAALKTARAEENTAKSEVSHMRGSEELVDQAQQLVAENEALISDLDKELVSVTEVARARSKAVKESSAQLDKLVASSDNYRNAQNALESKEKEIANAKAFLSRITEEMNSYAPPSKEIPSSAVLEEKGKNQAAQKKELQQKLEEVQANAVRHESQLASLVRSVDESKKEIEAQQTLVKSLSVESGLEESLKKELKQAESEVSTFVESQSRAEAEISGIEKQQSALTRSIAALKDSPHDANCPTCRTHLEDPATLIEDLENQVAELQERAKSLASELSDVKNSLNTARIRLSDVERRLDDLDSERRDLEQAQNALVSASERLTALQGEVEAAKDNKPSEGEIEALRKQITDLEIALEESRALFQSARLAERNKARFDQLSQEAEAKQNEINELEEALVEIQTYISSLPIVSETDLATARTAVRTAEQELEEAKSAYNNVEYQLGIGKERLAYAEKEYQQAKTDYERKKSALVALSQKAAVSDILDEFRKDRIASIAPELSETATSLISAMTNGYYTEVLLDENFTPSVIDIEGNERPVSWLSGGEESVVALALRIAIGDLMTGGEGGLLWLDEVLTAQDSARRSSLLNTLRNLTGRQIVMINHTPDANDMVDKILEVVETDNGSILETKLEKDEPVAELNP